MSFVGTIGATLLKYSLPVLSKAVSMASLTGMAADGIALIPSVIDLASRLFGKKEAISEASLKSIGVGLRSKDREKESEESWEATRSMQDVSSKPQSAKQQLLSKAINAIANTASMLSTKKKRAENAENQSILVDSPSHSKQMTSKSKVTWPNNQDEKLDSERLRCPTPLPKENDVVLPGRIRHFESFLPSEINITADTFLENGLISAVLLPLTTRLFESLDEIMANGPFDIPVSIESVGEDFQVFESKRIRLYLMVLTTAYAWNGDAILKINWHEMVHMIRSLAFNVKDNSILSRSFGKLMSEILFSVKGYSSAVEHVLELKRKLQHSPNFKEGSNRTGKDNYHLSSRMTNIEQQIQQITDSLSEINKKL
ncbi:hypothetical protein M3Y97_01043500 [Aphelenchoides bicaudatus]|nr:hypothetical protein M3Y97_01043500 [Aphelenchoides bicaudatus]